MKGLGRKAKDSEDEQRVVREYLEQFNAIPILNGQLIECFIPSGSSFAIVRHSLGRAYRGGMIAGISAGDVNVQTPGAAASSIDVTAYFVVGSSVALAADAHILVWLF